MTIQRMEHVGIVVDDLEAATAFSGEPGLKLQGEGQVEGGWVDRVVGLEASGWSTRWWRPRMATVGSSW
jgi:catechol 2,3-dioxygenase-like lactoylglutathione lyase family enzyme